MTLQVQRLLFLSLATILLCSKVSISGEVLNVDLNAVNDEFWMMPRSLVVREEKGEESCRPAGECEECTETRKKRQEVCGKTGKIQVYKCFVEEEGTETTTRTIFKSCRRTRADEEFLMVRFQVFCFLLGSLSFLYAKRQKTQSASLFDQRRLRRNSSIEVPNVEEREIESSPDEDSEMEPLTAKPLDVV
mmetsp:Transcript_24440/g.56957  ORF Transcript_24440/g.56957 Transcript_24440/m.56957 type:complete len:190 (+) Transcript_24440:725-1294(+)